MKDIIRAFCKLASVREFKGGSERKTAMHTEKYMKILAPNRCTNHQLQVEFTKSLIRKINSKFNCHPKLRQWFWFVVLWALGLFSVTFLSYFIKFLIRY